MVWEERGDLVFLKKNYGRKVINEIIVLFGKSRPPYKYMMN
jgi:hypothetical protein